MNLFFANFFFAVLFTVMAYDASKWTGRTGAVIFYLVIAAFNWLACATAVIGAKAEPTKAVVDKFLMI